MNKDEDQVYAERLATIEARVRATLRCIAEQECRLADGRIADRELAQHVLASFTTYLRSLEHLRVLTVEIHADAGP
ncbi:MULTISPECIES: hypothetical protein [unclassified Caballeronia]|uniref:hypothetical protein n=1 Tax=unclassified Caballeronia TaxID=2646786 RepID=UPI002029A0F8|nr:MULTISPECIES: hypothetical protein [unclassified Caballeronia]